MLSLPSTSCCMACRRAQQLAHCHLLHTPFLWEESSPNTDYHITCIQMISSFTSALIHPIQKALATLTQCINEIRSWMAANMLKLNNDKTEFFIATSPHNKQFIPPVTLQVGSDIIHPSETVRNLGVIFDTHMTMTSQISALCGSLNLHLRNITRIRRYLNFETCNHIIRSLLLSRIDNGNAILLGSNQTDITRLQRLQNWSAKLIFCARKYDHASPFLHQLHWLPVKERIAFKILLCVFKAINGLAPEYLTTLLTLYAPAREGLRSSTDTTLLDVPMIKSRTPNIRHHCSVHVEPLASIHQIIWLIGDVQNGTQNTSVSCQIVFALYSCL